MAFYRIHRFPLTAVLCALWVLLTGDCWAQFQSDPMAKLDARQVRQLQGKVRKILRSGSFDAQVFNQWYSQSFLPVMTSPKPAALGKLSERRRTLMKDLSLAADNASAHKALVDLIREKTVDVTKGKYHPSVQFNFVYLLGQLNDQEASISDRRPAVPHAQAFPLLVKFLTSENHMDAVKMAALLGIQRHVQLRTQFPAESGELSANEKANVTKALVTITNAKDPPKGRTREGHDWFRGVAAESLGYLGDPKAAIRK